MYKRQDQCGRTNTCTQTFNIDNAGPTITCPAEETVECYEDIQAIVDAHIADFNVGNNVVVACDLTYDITAAIDPKTDNCPTSITVTYTITDLCGRTDECMQTFNIDNATPTITCPAEENVECYEDIQAIVDANLANFNAGNDISASCDLGFSVVANLDPKTDNCQDSYSVTYVITDDCGRTAECSQTFILGEQMISITCPEQETVECYEDIQAIVDANLADFNAGNNVTVSCDLTFNVTAAIDPKVDNCPSSVNVVYTITDQCGLSSQCEQLFLIDNAGPEITCPVEEIVECYENIQAIVDAYIADFNAGNNVVVACDLTHNVTAVIDPKVDNCPTSVIVTYTITDQCGRTNECTQTYNIDNAGPEITCPAEETVECYEDIQAIVDAHIADLNIGNNVCLLYTSPSPRD